MSENLKITQLYDLDHTQAAEYLSGFVYPWEALGGIKEAIYKLSASLGDGYTEISTCVWAHRSAKIAPSAYIGAPCIIGEGTEIRHCAFIRGSALIGKNCVIGNSCELKNVVIFDGVQVPHYNYVGDSILGYKAHMGAGSITSNVKSDRSEVIVRSGGEAIRTGLRKCGAMLGDFAEIGCNSVLNPGTVIGRNTTVYPLTSVRGAFGGDMIIKSGKVAVKKS